jgi:uncharacterized protein (TIGR02246 family)
MDEATTTLEARLRAMEDVAEISRLVSAYGPAVDSGSVEEVANLWTEDGVYDTESAVWRGREAIAGMVRGDTHQALIGGGGAHVLGAPHIVVDGDRAVATCYSRVFRHHDGDYQVWRVAANRWELVRTPDGWRATYRTNRLLNGTDASRQLLSRFAEL